MNAFIDLPGIVIHAGAIIAFRATPARFGYEVTLFLKYPINGDFQILFTLPREKYEKVIQQVVKFHMKPEQER